MTILKNKTFSLAEYIAFFLESKEIKNVFQLSGGMIVQMIDAISLRRYTTVNTLLHEQSCAFAISAIGRITNRPSFAFATSGPGATNLITGIGDCYFDSIPAVFITGQVNSYELKGERDLRQLGFQEANIVEMVKPITKLAIQLNENDDIIKVLEDAYTISVSGRPGPVLIDIPMNLQKKQIELSEKLFTKESNDECNLNLRELIDLLQKSERPLIWAGNGIHLSSSEDIFRKLIDIIKVPTVFTLHGIDLLPTDSKYRIGMIGSYGNRWANLCVKDSDLIIFIGSRIDIRQTGANLEIFKDKTIIRIDIDKSEIEMRLKSNIKFNVDVYKFISSLIYELEQIDINLDFSDWISSIQKLKALNPVQNEMRLNENDLSPYEFIENLSSLFNKKVIYSVDVGAHQMWAAQSLKFKIGDRFLTSGGMGSMGFSIPAAIGAKIEDNQKEVIVLVGDGSFQINIQELQFIAKNNLNIKIVVFNNESLGMIKQFQDSYMSGRYFGTQWGYSVPDICAISNAYGISSMSISKNDEIANACNWLKNENGPKLLELKLRDDLNIYPKIAFGQTMDKMEPDFKPLSL